MPSPLATLPARADDAPSSSHAADRVFADLADAIVSGPIEPGATLPPERVIAEHYRASRPIVRQAIHRLEDMGLVRCRQGGSTVVLDPLESADPRVIALLYRANSAHARSTHGMRDVIEKQFLQGLALTEIAARRGRSEHLDAVVSVVNEFAADRPREAEFAAFEERFWRAVAAAGDNTIYRMEIAWWYRVVPRAPSDAPGRPAPAPLATRVAFYRELARRIRAREGAAEYYLGVIGPILAALAPAPAPPTRAAKPSRRR